MAAKFEVSSNGKGGFQWILTSQGRTLAHSEPYSRKASCLNAIESLRKAAATATVSDGTASTGNAGAKSTGGTRKGGGARKAAASRTTGAPRKAGAAKSSSRTSAAKSADAATAATTDGKARGTELRAIELRRASVADRSS